MRSVLRVPYNASGVEKVLKANVKIVNNNSFFKKGIVWFHGVGHIPSNPHKK